MVQQLPPASPYAVPMPVPRRRGRAARTVLGLVLALVVAPAAFLLAVSVDAVPGVRGSGEAGRIGETLHLEAGRKYSVVAGAPYPPPGGPGVRG